MISFGTWQYNSSTAEDAVKLAIQTGFNHIDTANNYNNQDGVGRALKGLDRSSYFLTTKVPPDQSFPSFVSALDDNLKLLGVDYVDLVLIHYTPLEGYPWKDCTVMQNEWQAMEDFYKSGKAKA